MHIKKYINNFLWYQDFYSAMSSIKNYYNQYLKFTYQFHKFKTLIFLIILPIFIRLLYSDFINSNMHKTL